MMKKNDLPFIVAIDGDGTLWKDEYPDIGKIHTKTVEYVKYLRRLGAKLIFWTCREGKDLEKALETCKELDLEFDAVNDNIKEVKEKYSNNSRKVFANMYLDDRCFMPAEVYDKLIENMQ